MSAVKIIDSPETGNQWAAVTVQFSIRAGKQPDQVSSGSVAALKGNRWIWDTRIFTWLVNKCSTDVHACDSEKKGALVLFLPSVTNSHCYPCEPALLQRRPHISMCALSGRLPTPQDDVFFGLVKIENYNAIDMSAFAFSTLSTIDAKHNERCVGSTRVP